MRKKLFIFSGLFFLLSFLILYFGPGAVQAIRANLYNSDILFPFSLYKSFFQPGSHADWILGSNTPYLELALGLVVWALTAGNIHLSLALYAILQPVLLTGCLLYLAYCVLGKNRLLYSLVVLFSALPILSFAVGLTRPLFFLFAWYVHMLTLGLALLALGLVIQIVFGAPRRSESTRVRLYLLCLITVLATTSDALFIFQLAAPLLVVLAALSILSLVSLKKAGLAALSLMIGTGLGQVLYSLPLLVGANRVGLVGSFMNTGRPSLLVLWRFILARISDAWNGGPAGWILWIGFYGACLAVALMLIWQRTHGQHGRVRGRIIALFLFFLLQLAANLSSALISANGELRYFMPVVYIPLFWGWPFVLILIPGLVKRFRGKLALHMGWVFLGVAFALLAVFWVTNRDRPVLDGYYPGQVACIDMHASELGLNRGITQYWSARNFMLLSKDNVVLVQVTHSMAPFHYLNNSDWYRDNFDFILADPLNTSEYLVSLESVVARFGEPAASYNCGGIEMMVYNRWSDQLFKRQFRIYLGFGAWQ